jgi:glycopeptide antibiotics resistance protein
MWLEFYPFPLLIGAFVIIAFVVILWRRKYRFSYLFPLGIFCLYLLLVMGLTLFPIPIPSEGGAFGSRQPTLYILSRVNLIPFDYDQFKNLAPLFVFMREVVDNILLTIPLGFGICFFTRLRVKQILLLAISAGLGIETTQLAMCLILGVAYRGVDINDAIMNALGVMTGYGLFRLLSWQPLNKTDRRDFLPK